MPTVTKPSSSHFDGLLAPRKKQPSANTLGSSKNDPNDIADKPKAKSKNPEFRSATLYLRKKTLMEAEYKLKRTDDSRDMSELAEELMAAWVATPDA
jgi:hypothetical protein